MTRDLPAGGQRTRPATSTSASARPQRPGGTGPSARRQAPPAAGGAPDARVPRLPVSIGSPASLLAVVPGLLGFDPGQSIVVIGIEPPRAQVRVTLRYDVPDPRRPRLAEDLARHAVSLLAAQGLTTAAVVGYGPDPVVAPAAAALREHAAEAGITMFEMLRAEGQRYWSYVCADPGCCPPEGTPFDVAGHPAARALTAAGGRVLAGRSELAATIGPARGQLGAAMRRATAEAREQIAMCAARLDHAGGRAATSRVTAALGQIAVQDAICRYRGGESVDPEYAAWLTVALRELRVRDDAWARMDPEHRDAHLRLWADLTRLARPGYVAAPATLLAFTAWQSGDGALANVALDRALADNPRYSMATLLRDALDAGAPPSLARLPMTPEEVAAAYDDAEAREAARA